jgi:putative ABC transport system permease protein
MNPQVPTWAGVGASAALVALAILVAWRGRLHLAREIAIAAVRAAVQLAAVGAILLLVFAHTGLAGAVGWLAAMVLIAGRVAARRARGLPHALANATTAITIGTAATLGALLRLGVIAALITARLAERALFDHAHRLRHLTTPAGSPGS